MTYTCIIETSYYIFTVAAWSVAPGLKKIWMKDLGATDPICQKVAIYDTQKIALVLDWLNLSLNTFCTNIWYQTFITDIDTLLVSDILKHHFHPHKEK